MATQPCVAVYCGAGDAVDVPYTVGAEVRALVKDVVNALQATLANRKGRVVQTSDVNLWRVSHNDDLYALQGGARLEDVLQQKHALRSRDATPVFQPGDSVWVQLVHDGAPAAVPAATTATGGGTASTAAAAATGGSPTLAELMAKQAEQAAQLAKLEAQQAAVDAELLPMLQKGMFNVLDKVGHPNCCGFFVRESGVALTVNHGNGDWLLPGDVVRAVMLRDMAAYGAAQAAAAEAAATDDNSVALLPDEVLLTFKVHSFSDSLDYTCLILTSPVPPGTFHPLPLPPVGLSIDKLIGAHATLLHGSIALNRLFNMLPSASLFPCTIVTAHDDRVLYNAATAGGDSVGALVLHGKVLIAMHVEGLNDVGDTEVLSPTGGKGSRTKRMRLSEASPSTAGSAIRLDLCTVQQAIAAADEHIQQAVAAAAGSSAGGGT